ncbi:MAG: glycosyl transferase family 4 [Nanoarchaeota archaeon]
MIEHILVLPVLVTFIVTFFIIPSWIKKAHQIDLMWEDMNKLSKLKVAGSGGISTLVGFVIGILLYIGLLVFYLKENNNLIEMFSLLTVILLVGGLGFIDDLLGWRKGGLSKRTRIVLVALSSIPLVVINAGKSSILLPLIGNVDLGLIYPLFLIPLAITGTTTTFNFLAGFNGLEAGQGIFILSALSIVAYLTGHTWLAFIAICMIASLLAFLIFNFYPAKIFPGDSLTYPIGAMIAIMAILGNFEKIAMFFFIPYLIETILKLRGGLKKYSFGRPKKDNFLELEYDKIYSLNHLAIYLINKYNGKANEKKVVLAIWLFQIFIIVLGFLIFYKGIFI